MTPQNKAKELVEKYNMHKTLFYVIDIHQAKECALIAVNELLETTKRYDYTLGPNPSYNDYWLKVKYQIEKL